MEVQEGVFGELVDQLKRIQPGVMGRIERLAFGTWILCIYLSLIFLKRFSYGLVWPIFKDISAAVVFCPSSCLAFPGLIHKGYRCERSSDSPG